MTRLQGIPFKFYKSQLIIRLKRRVIQRWNGNFVEFSSIILEIVKNYPKTHNLYFSGKW